MSSKQFTLTSALAYDKEGNIEEWVHNFLCGEGNNKPFSDGLKLVKRHYIGPIKMKLILFERCCGPESDLKFVIDENNFNNHVSNMVNEIKNGWDMPPLIINYEKGNFELSDGNHRFEALTRANIDEHHVIIWITDEEDYIKFKEDYLI